MDCNCSHHSRFTPLWFCLPVPTLEQCGEPFSAYPLRMATLYPMPRNHERGHAREAMPILQRYQQQFQNLRIAQMGPSAREAEEAAQRELRSQVGEVFNLLRHDTEESITRYDRRTRHGRNQGAQLRTSLDRRRR